MKQSAMSPRTGRIIELDIAKGLGILSVILYHTLPASPLHTALGGYMMPLFFVVSGLVMQRDACSFSLRRFWEKNARLLFYYILFSAIYLLCSVVTCIAGHGSYKALALDGIAALVGCGFNVLWFFSALFFGKLLCSLLTGSPLLRWAQGLFLAGLFLLAVGIGRAVDFTALSGVGRVARLVYAGHVLSPAHCGSADNRHGTGAATGPGSARLGSPLHRTEKRSDKPGALLTFRSRFAMIPR